MIREWLLVALIVGSSTLGDVLQSWEMKRTGPIEHFRPRNLLSQLRQLSRRPLLGLSFAAMALSFFAFLTLLASADLSFAVPATALGIVAETLAARYVLKEKVDYRRWLGILLVGAGVALLAM